MNENTMKLIQDGKALFTAAVGRVDPAKMVEQFVSCEGDRLSVKNEQETVDYNLSDFHQVIVIGAGKASAKMALGLEAVLSKKISNGLVVVKTGHTEKLQYIDLLEAAHPIPDESCVTAANKIADLCREADENTLIINLISGGGSALLTAPYQGGDHLLTLDDIQRVTGLLLSCGAVIQELNIIRKHLSALQGGRLAELASPATMISLILSDVIGDPLDAIASGPTVPDSTRWQDVGTIIQKYNLTEKLPKGVKNIVVDGLAGLVDETPKERSEIFKTVKNILIGTNISALRAASDKAEVLGYTPVILTSQLSGEAREVAKFFSAMCKDMVRDRLAFKRPACFIAGGETTVTLRGKGLGGRNQEMAMAYMMEFLEDPAAMEGALFLSGGTDGNDGPTDAAGGFVHASSIRRIFEKGLDPQEYMNNSDSYHLLEEVDSLLVTGPTNTNVCDVQILLVR